MTGKTQKALLWMFVALAVVFLVLVFVFMSNESLVPTFILLTVIFAFAAVLMLVNIAKKKKAAGKDEKEQKP